MGYLLDHQQEHKPSMDNSSNAVLSPALVLLAARESRLLPFRLLALLGFLALLLLLLGGSLLLRDQASMDVRQDTTSSDGDVPEELVELLIVPDSKGHVAGDDPCTLVVPSSVPSELEDLRSQVFQDSSEVDRSTARDSLSVLSLAQVTRDTTDRELQTSTSASGLRLSRLGLSTTTFSFSGHFLFCSV